MNAPREFQPSRRIDKFCKKKKLVFVKLEALQTAIGWTESLPFTRLLVDVFPTSEPFNCSLECFHPENFSFNPINFHSRRLGLVQAFDPRAAVSLLRYYSRTASTRKGDNKKISWWEATEARTVQFPFYSRTFMNTGTDHHHIVLPWPR